MPIRQVAAPAPGLKQGIGGFHLAPFMTKADFLQSVTNMTEEQKRELLVQLREVSEWLSEDLIVSKSVIEGAGAAGKSYAAMFGVN